MICSPGGSKSAKHPPTKQSAAVILASYLWAIQEGCRTASAIYRAIRHNLFPDKLPERSRFFRICQNLAQVFSVCAIL